MSTSSPQPDTIEKLGKAVYPSFAMLAGMKLDLFTPLKNGPMTAQQIADELGVRAAKLEPLLYTKRDGRIRSPNTGIGSRKQASMK